MSAAVDLVIQPRARDLGDFEVRRVLPYAKRRSVGPFVFFDHMGPVVFPPGKGVDVRPHPHIGLATITYLFEGEIIHRDSLGVVQPIRPGAVNWMVAGSGIVHSERTDPAVRDSEARMHGIQTWIALPQADEEADPSFDHHTADEIPEWHADGVEYRLVAGTASGRMAPARVFSPMFYIAVEAPDGGPVNLTDEHAERALYVVDGSVTVDGDLHEAGSMVVFTEDSAPVIVAGAGSRLMLIGGAPLDGTRTIWWNFVSSSKERIEQAKSDWKDGNFTAVPGEVEFIPLPEE